MLQRASLLFMALLAAPVHAANPYEDLLRDVPFETNVLVLLNPQRAYASALAKQQDWTKQFRDRHRAGVTLLPPDARQAVIATDVNFNNLTRDFQVALANVRQTSPLQELQRREGGAISEIAGRFVLLSPRDAYITPLNVSTLATVYPANRQALARWLRYVTGNRTNLQAALTPVLRKAADEWADRAEVVVALDLSDAIDPGVVRDGINQSLALSGKNVNRDTLARVLASANGLVFAATIGSSINCTIRVDFNLDPQPFRESVQALFLENLDTHGLQIPGISQWNAVFNGTSMTLTGAMTTQDLQRVIGLFHFPSTQEGEPPVGTPATPQGVDVAAVSPDQTRRFLTAVDNILQGVKPPKEAQTLQQANEYTKYALATEQASQQIDQLSRANVDPVAVEAARDSAKRLKGIAGSLRGVPVDLNVINAGSFYNVSGGFPGWLGWGRGSVPFIAGRSTGTNLPQVNERMLRVIADDQKRRDEMMSQIQSTMNEARMKLAEKFGGKW